MDPNNPPRPRQHSRHLRGAQRPPRLPCECPGLRLGGPRHLAQRAYATKDPALIQQAWAFHGYADHFLQDSFAAGHLVNKTLVMQWFIQWAATQSLLPVADWDEIKNMTTAHQSSLAGPW